MNPTQVNAQTVHKYLINQQVKRWINIFLKNFKKWA